MAITVSAKTRVTVASGALAGMGSYTVATDDLVVFPIMTDANFGDPTHVVSQTAGTATIGTPARLIHQQSGGQFDIHAVRITAGGTVTFSASNPSSVRMSCAPLVLTGTVTGTPSAAVNVSGQGGSTTNNINVGATTTVAACAAVVGGTEWNDLGSPTTSDLTNLNAFNTAGASMSGASGWKTVAAAGAFTGNLDAAGAGAADWDWGAVAFAPATGGGITGTVAVTLAAFTSSASGTSTPPAITGTVAVTLAAFTSSASGTYTPPPITGSVAVTLAAFTSTASGTYTPPPITGTVARTLNPFTAAASGTYTPPAITGTTAVTLGVFVAAGSGTVAGPGAITGTAAVTLNPFTSTASGTFTAPGVTGTSATTLGPFTAIGSGTFTPAGITGTVAVTLGLFIAAAFEAFQGPIITGPLLTGHDNDPRLTDPVPVDRTTTAALGERTTEAAP